MNKEQMIERDIAEEQQRHEANMVAIKEKAEQRWHDYFVRVEAIKEAEEIALRSVREGFKAQRDKLEAEFYPPEEAPEELQEGTPVDSNELIAPTNSELVTAVADINRIPAT